MLSVDAFGASLLTKSSTLPPSNLLTFGFSMSLISAWRARNNSTPLDWRTLLVQLCVGHRVC